MTPWMAVAPTPQLGIHERVLLVDDGSEPSGQFNPLAGQGHCGGFRDPVGVVGAGGLGFDRNEAVDASGVFDNPVLDHLATVRSSRS